MTSPFVTIVGGGLAGCEAAYQLAERGHSVLLHEMKPKKRTPAQRGDGLCELVCSNSLRGAALTNAVGLLKEELSRAGSLIMRAALEARVPAGGALAVDRERFSAIVTSTIREHGRIELCCEEVTAIPSDRPVILATGPLTADALAADLSRAVGSEHLAYYDAIAPIVDAESIDWNRVWRQSRYDKGGDDYVNCPFDEEQYRTFVRALLDAAKVDAHDFEDVRYFEGCLPLEVMAERGENTLAFGPMKPVGLIDPRTGKRPFAVVQLRPEDSACTAYNLVGFQTRMKWPEQQRIFRTITGLENAEFLRLGAVHRNTFVDAPALLDATMQLRTVPDVYVAGQLSGVEGYVESAAGGLVCAVMLAQRLSEREVTLPPATTALGGILTHLSRSHPKAKYQPSNITWAHLPPLAKRAHKRERYRLMAERALADLEPWLRA
ncbi:MAG TPA: methylenetetrahydrofolate--tRNA-(uracil(54)-C(5))-methyltransferase (FADH(2)-oxidizing) TrmFO, partial [Polyangiaceae bacterium]|nr:methylenetetrahydrofolate--tRNA-(uracil(54)-C(5))-methyltransferase (FADH(2)-oxidizing) TrmFO [Polyangiaceae bacterium]